MSCALLTGEGAAASDKANIVRDLAGRVGPILGSALACQDIARPRIQLIVDKFTAVIAEASTNDTERSDLTQLLDRNVANGRGAVTSGQTDCRQADRQLADLERSIAAPALPAVIAPPAPAAAPAVPAS
ncbi:MAG TPA: ABC transporter substrate-binding protein, partial [Bradyrhizobium sp.]|nr:ABC transporter substrate-binding protein [Bradyrhizobium sp.]